MYKIPTSRRRKFFTNFLCQILRDDNCWEFYETWKINKIRMSLHQTNNAFEFDDSTKLPCKDKISSL